MDRPDADPALPGRGSGVWILAGIHILVAGCLLLWVMSLSSARAWEVDKSFDVDEELQAALIGLDILIRLSVLAAGGFLLAGAAVLTRRRAGWFLAVLWAALMTLTGIGAVYGLPALVWLLARSTRERFI